MSTSEALSAKHSSLKWSSGRVHLPRDPMKSCIPMMEKASWMVMITPTTLDTSRIHMPRLVMITLIPGERATRRSGRSTRSTRSARSGLSCGIASAMSTKYDTRTIAKSSLCQCDRRYELGLQTKPSLMTFIDSSTVKMTMQMPSIRSRSFTAGDDGSACGVSKARQPEEMMITISMHQSNMLCETSAEHAFRIGLREEKKSTE